MMRHVLVVLGVVGLALGVAPRVASAQTDYTVQLQCDSDDYVYGAPFSTVSCQSSNGVADLTLIDLDGGGTVEDGDTVVFQTNNIMNFRLFSIDGPHSGNPLDVDVSFAFVSANEEFTIENIDCDNCDITDGTRVSLQNQANGKFMSAASCGGGGVGATATSRGSCEIFEITGDFD